MPNLQRNFQAKVSLPDGPLKSPLNRHRRSKSYKMRPNSQVKKTENVRLVIALHSLIFLSAWGNRGPSEVPAVINERESNTL